MVHVESGSPDRLLADVDVVVHAAYLNAITSGTGGLRRSRTPMLLADDGAVLRAAVAMCGAPHLKVELRNSRRPAPARTVMRVLGRTARVRLGNP